MRRTCFAAIFLGAMTTAWLTAEPAAPPAANSQPVVAQGRGQGRGGRAGSARPRTRKAVLAWADTRNGIAQHDSTSHALSVIERLGYESGAYDTFIRTDSNIVANQPQMTTGAPASGGPNLTNVDAVFFLGHREIALEPQQRADLVAFVRDSGKGFVAAHTALTAFDSWPEFGDLLGGRYDDHPWNTASGTIINEDPSFPATKHFPETFAFTDEFYQPKAFSRDKLRVLLRLDVSKMPANPQLHRTDGDFPLAWAKNYGKGRVFYSSLGHAAETWDNRDVALMYFEAIRWALGLTEGDATPRPMPTSR
jgi:type 1 glutamine amidotransferase